MTGFCWLYNGSWKQYERILARQWQDYLFVILPTTWQDCLGKKSWQDPDKIGGAGSNLGQGGGAASRKGHFILQKQTSKVAKI